MLRTPSHKNLNPKAKEPYAPSPDSLHPAWEAVLDHNSFEMRTQMGFGPGFSSEQKKIPVIPIGVRVSGLGLRDLCDQYCYSQRLLIIHVLIPRTLC